MQRHRFTAWLEPHISTCVGDCMYIVLRFWRSSVRTRLVSDAGCTRWAHLGRGPHCRPMGLELSGMLPVPRRGNRDSRCGVGLYCARRLSAMAVGQKRHSPAGRVRILRRDRFHSLCHIQLHSLCHIQLHSLSHIQPRNQYLNLLCIQLRNLFRNLFHNLFHKPRLVFHSLFHSLSISRCPA